MPILSELEEEKFQRVFVMGAAGTGKSIFACGFPGPIKLFDFDGKVDSVHSYYSKHSPGKLSEIDFEDCRPVDKKGTSFKRANDIIGKLKREPELPFKTLVIDSSTIMSTEMLNWIVAFETGIARNTKIKSRVVACRQDYMIFSPTFQDFIYELFALPCNIVMTGHIKVDKDELTGQVVYAPFIPGQMAGKIPMLFPEVYVSSVKQGKYILQTQADYKYPCRSQIQGIPKEIESNYNNLIKGY